MPRLIAASPFAALLAEGGVGEPLKHNTFRRIWLASLLSNLGLLIQGVGAAWSMTELSASPDMVALVQTSLMAPVMLWSVAAGAIADMYDRRRVALMALSLALAGSTLLSVLSLAGLTTPGLLLAFCFVIGSGIALFSPAWQASVSEQVPAETLPSAIALNGISYNIARSFGPAVGGAIVAALGASAAFVVNALLYLPLLVVLYLWKRSPETTRLPPERLTRAIVSGVRYIFHSPPIRVVLLRTLTMTLAGAGLSALMPLVSKDLLGGGPGTYGVMLGCFGVGAVIGALNVSAVRRRIDGEGAIRLCGAVLVVAIATVALSRWGVLTAAALIVGGAVWMLAMTLLNIGVQMSAPRWVSGRALAGFQAATSGGIAIGSWGWGWVADHWGTQAALLASAVAMVLTPLAGRFLRLPEIGERAGESEELADPQVSLALTARSGPIVIEVEYRIDPANARVFHNIMQDVQHSRQRNGAYGWSIARDIADTSLWIERFHCPTWLDYLRQRNRPTEAERELHRRAEELQTDGAEIRIRRMLERPFGSVRWKDEAPDRGPAGVIPVNTNG